MVAFFSIPCCLPRNICIICFPNSKIAYASLNVCIFYPLLGFSPVLFFSHLKVQKQYWTFPLSFLLPHFHMGSLFQLSFLHFPFCAAFSSLYAIYSPCSWAIHSFSDKKGNKTKTTIYVPGDMKLPFLWNNIAHLWYKVAALHQCEILDALP